MFKSSKYTKRYSQSLQRKASDTWLNETQYSEVERLNGIFMWNLLQSCRSVLFIMMIDYWLFQLPWSSTPTPQTSAWLCPKTSPPSATPRKSSRSQTTPSASASTSACWAPRAWAPAGTAGTWRWVTAASGRWGWWERACSVKSGSRRAPSVACGPSPCTEESIARGRPPALLWRSRRNLRRFGFSSTGRPAESCSRTPETTLCSTSTSTSLQKNSFRISPTHVKDIRCIF